MVLAALGLTLGLSKQSVLSALPEPADPVQVFGKGDSRRPRPL